MYDFAKTFSSSPKNKNVGGSSWKRMSFWHNSSMIGKLKTSISPYRYHAVRESTHSNDFFPGWQEKLWNKKTREPSVNPFYLKAKLPSSLLWRRNRTSKEGGKMFRPCSKIKICWNYGWRKSWPKPRMGISSIKTTVSNPNWKTPSLRQEPCIIMFAQDEGLTTRSHRQDMESIASETGSSKRAGAQKMAIGEANGGKRDRESTLFVNISPIGLFLWRRLGRWFWGGWSEGP